MKWTDKGNGPTGRSIDTGKGYGFSIIPGIKMSREEQDAIARIIVAAPEMLHVLQELSSWLVCPDVTPETLQHFKDKIDALLK